MTKRLFKFSIFLVIINMVVILYFMIFKANAPGTEDMNIKGGVMDATTISFLGDDTFARLDGEWRCYPGIFATPTNLRISNIKPEFVMLPSFITDLEGYEDRPDAPCTYQLDVKMNGIPGVYALKTGAIFDNYEVWINEEKIYTTADEYGNFRSYYIKPSVLSFYSDGTDITITICVRNENHPNGGISDSLFFGSATRLDHYRLGTILMSVLVFALCFITFLYNLFNFLVNRRDRVFLFFAMLCLFVSIRCLIRYEVIFTMIFPNMPYRLGSLLHYGVLPAAVLAIVHYLDYFYENCLPKWFFTIVATGATLYLLEVLLYSPTTYIPLYTGFIAFSCLIILAGMYVFTKALIKDWPGAQQFAYGSYMFMVGVLLDFATYFGVIRSKFTIAIGMSGYIIMMATALIRKNVIAQKEETRLYFEQQEALDKARLTRNDFLSSQMKPHFLYNTLNNIAENCYSDPATAKKLIAALREYMKRTLKIDSRTNLVTIDQELELVHAYTFIEETRFKGLVVEYDLPDPLPPVKIPMLSLQPLVENAIKHGVRRQPDNGKVVVKIQPIENYILFTVMDTGVGMDEEQVARLFKKPTGNKSIGMYNINYRLHELYNTGLNVTSILGEGTCISFKIPY